MAGRTRRNAALTELEVRASRQGITPLEYVEDWLSSGKTLVKLADDMTRTTALEITRNILDKLALTLEADAPQRISDAHKAGAHAMVERQHERVEALGDGGLLGLEQFVSKEQIALENLRSKNVQWLAGKKNRDDFGDTPAIALNLQSLGALHLHVMRTLSAEDARVLSAKEQQKQISDGEYVIEPEGEELL